MIGIPIGLLTANGYEWFVHRYVLQGLGENEKSFWSFHWHDHYGNSQRNESHDVDYEKSVFGWHGQGKEAQALVGAGLLHLPLLPIAPFFTGLSETSNPSL